MAGINQYQPFANGSSALVLAPSAYASDSQLATGSQPGIARVDFNNTTLRQCSMIAAAIAQFIANTGADVQDDGNLSNLVTLLTNALTVGYAFNESAPPASPIALQVGNRLTISFAGVASIPLHVACSPGLYRVIMALTANNANYSDMVWEPNDITYAGQFSSVTVESGDQIISSLGNATTQAGTSSMTVAPYIAGIPLVIPTPTANGFYFDHFFGPDSSDNVNDRGMLIDEFIVSTYTSAKMIKQSGGITGGASIGFAKWNDTTTPWTSLGTLTSQATSVSGTVIVERLA